MIDPSPPPATRVVGNGAAHDARRQPVGRGRPAALLVLGSAEPSLRALEGRLASLNGTGPRVVGVLARSVRPEALPWLHLGPLESFDSHLDGGGITEVAVCLDDHEWPLLEAVVEKCARRSVSVLIPVPDVRERRHDSVAGSPSAIHERTKRLVDVIGAGLGLVAAAPLLAMAALAIVLTDRRPVFFRQLRAGRDGRPFRIVKFRTMQREADAQRRSLRSVNELNGAAFKLTNDPRVTRLGRLLRRTSLDELPQLWNVLRGDMSLVGPRPHPYDDLAGYERWHLGRLAVKPGLTGLWQVEMRGDADFDRGVELDLAYIARRSVLLDLQIILRTVPAVLRGTGR